MSEDTQRAALAAGDALRAITNSNEGQLCLKRKDKLRAVFTEHGRLAKWGKLIGTFLVGQVLLQLLNAITGILLIRWMPVEAYAQYTLANAFQLTAQQFVELGLSGSLIALVGHDVANKRRLGRLIAAGQYYRSRLAIVVSVVCCIVFPRLAYMKGWSTTVVIALTTTIVGFLFATGVSAYYRPALQMHSRIATIYTGQIGAGILRLAGAGTIALLHVLSAPIIAGINVIVIALDGKWCKHHASEYVETCASPLVEDRREMLLYIRPILPSIVFMALQGQIAVFIIGVFGNVANIAEVGALGRFGFLFAIVSAASGTVVAPYIARQPRSGLLRKYIGISLTGVLVSAGHVVAATSLSRPLLSLLGGGYRDLHHELLLMMVNAGLVYLGNLFWCMNAARKWVWWWMPVLTIPGVLAVQGLSCYVFDVGTTAGVLSMSIAVSAYILMTRLVVAGVGFWEDC